MATKRKPITIQLSPIKDKALIKQIDNLTVGSRNAELKEKLTLGFGIETDRTAKELADLRREVAELRALVAAIPVQLKAMLSAISIDASKAVAIPEQEAPRISDDEIKKREQNLKKRSW